MRCADVIVEYLRRADVGHLFGYPGDPNIELMEAARRGGLEFVLARREGTAGFMAQAYAQLCGRPGVCMSTLGPGSSNLVNAVANAFLDRVPMLALSGQIETGRAPFFTHQVLDHNRLFSPVAKWVTEIQPHTVGTIMRKAMRTAVAERPGPVHITTAADVIGAEALDDGVALPPLRPNAGAVQAFAPRTDADTLDRLRTARRPIAVVGIAARRAAATASLTALAEHLGMPVVASPMAKGVMPEDHAYFAGTLDMACSATMWALLGSADLLLCIGFDAVELIKPWRLRIPTIHIDAVPNTDQVYSAELELVGDIPATLAALNAGLGDSAPRWTPPEVAAHRDALRCRYLDGRVAGRLNPSDVIETLRAALPRDTVVSTDVGSHKLLVGQGWATYVPDGMLMTNGLSSMGYGLPAAIAAKLLLGSRPVVCFTGDGGLAMVQGELALAASLRLGVIVVVFIDMSLNRIEIKQQARSYPSWGTRLERVDTVKLAESMQCHGVEVDSVAGLERVMAEAGDLAAPLVIGAKIAPEQYRAQFD